MHPSCIVSTFDLPLVASLGGGTLFRLFIHQIVEVGSDFCKFISPGAPDVPNLIRAFGLTALQLQTR
jgi:hypothetical protein